MTRFLHILLFLSLLSTACRQPYEAPVHDYETNLLVVQGFINSNGITTINLSRTTPLSGIGMLEQSAAIVQIEGDDNTVYPLSNGGGGVYISDDLSLNSAVKYRLYIRTPDGKNYRSDYRTMINTPAVDSITFTRPGGGINLYINAYDPSGNTRYYKWNYEETWEIKSKYESFLVYHLDFNTLNIVISYYDSVDRTRNESIYRCWNNRNSSGIKIGNTIKLQEDRVYHNILHYQQGAEELSELYSIQVKQQGLSREGYEFYEKMRKNTESLGSIFDPLPSELKGNIYCEEDAREVVIGFIEVTNVTEKRVFISKDQLPDWNYDSRCEEEVYVPPYRDSLLAYIHYPGRLPTKFGMEGFVFAAKKECVDCTLKGSNTKPSFWPL